jgi:hypothetical protein
MRRERFGGGVRGETQCLVNYVPRLNFSHLRCCKNEKKDRRSFKTDWNERMDE